MGKTKTAFVEGVAEDKLSSEDKYKQKLAKRKAEEEKKFSSSEASKDKRKVEGLGLRGGAKIKVVGGDLPKEKRGAEKTPKAAVLSEVKQAEEPEEKTDQEAEVEKETPEKEKGVRVRGKNYTGAKSKVDANKHFPISDAVKLIKSLSFAKFDETYELHMTVKKQGLNVNLTLPHNFGKGKKIEVASEETLEKLKAGKIDFDVLLATAEMMPKLVVFAKILGPKGLMPNPKNGTVIKSEKDAEKFSADQKTLKMEKDQPIIHTTVGKLSMEEKDVVENIQAVIEGIGKPQIAKVYLKSTMSPSVKLTF